MMLPVKCNRCGLYGDAALSLLSHEICHCVPVVHICQQEERIPLLISKISDI